MERDYGASADCCVMDLRQGRHRGLAWGQRRGGAPFPYPHGGFAFPSDTACMNNWCVHIHDYTTMLLPCFLAARLNNGRPLCLHTHTGRGYVPVWFIVRLLHRHTDPDKSPSSSHDWSADIHGMSPGLFWALHFKRGPAHDRHLTRSGCFATIPRLSENQPAHTLNLRQAVSLQRAVLHLMDAY